jgi:cytochrome c oxidase assembly protein subunit 11
MPNRNSRTGLIILAVVVFMGAMSFAAVPLYRLFCQATGFDGTTMVSEKLPDHIVDRTITVKFNTDVGRNMLWAFHAEQRQVDVKLGQKGLISFDAENRDKVPVSGVAVYNVTPPKAGKYFHKMQCFCFGEQTLNPGEKATYPVIFYIDPNLNDDPNMDNVEVITLSYTFFPSDTPELEAAIANFQARAATAGTVALPPKTE